MTSCGRVVSIDAGVSLDVIARLTIILLDAYRCVSNLLGSVVLLLLLVLLLLVLSGEHVHARCRHEDWTEMAHVLWLTHNVLRDAKNDAVTHHLGGRILLRMTLSRHHLL